MTCIVGVLDKEHVYIGGDTFGSNGYTGFDVNRSKVFKVDDFIIGGTSSFRMLDLLEFSLSLRRPYLDEDMEKYMRTHFVDMVRKTLSDGGYKKTNNGVESGGIFLVAYGKNLWEVQADFSVLTRKPFCAVGSGEEVAMGSLITTEGMEISPEEKIRYAIGSACKYVVSVGGDITILTTKK